jgi:ssDNA-binding Zn-finger/Zn-ribbon topoisomerase 1
MGNKDNKTAQLICVKCNVPLQIQEVKFKYLGYQFKHNFPKCPSCGQIYISEDIVNGKMKEVEQILEDK